MGGMTGSGVRALETRLGVPRSADPRLRGQAAACVLGEGPAGSGVSVQTCTLTLGCECFVLRRVGAAQVFLVTGRGSCRPEKIKGARRHVPGSPCKVQLSLTPLNRCFDSENFSRWVYTAGCSACRVGFEVVSGTAPLSESAASSDEQPKLFEKTQILLSIFLFPS